MKRFVTFALLLLFSGVGFGQTLSYAVPGYPATLDAGDSDDGNSIVVSSQVTERLVTFAPGTTDLAPALATSWNSNEDGTVWTFQLREGVTFHDGTPFDAAAVKFNVDRWNEPDEPTANRSEGKTYAPWDFVFGGAKYDGNDDYLVESVEVLGEHEVRFIMTRPTPFLPSLLAAPYFQIGSPAAITAGGELYGTPSVGAVGTGPFEFVEWVPGERVVLERFDDYWGGPASLERVVFRGIEEPSARLAELQAGTVNLAVLLAADDLAMVQNDPSLVELVAASELNVGYLGFFQTNEPLGDVRVRQAIAHAIDREAIVDAFYAGLGVVPEDHLPPVLFGHGDEWPYEYDPDLAKQLLAEAGYPDGFQTELWYMPVSRPYFPAPRPIAETIATYLQDVGIDAALLTEDWATYILDYSTGKFPLYMLGWSLDYADPDNILMGLFGPTSEDEFGWSEPSVLEALTEARQSTDLSERAALYASVNDTLAAEVVSVPMAHNRTLNASSTSVTGWVASPLGFHAVSLQTVGKAE